MKLNKSLKAAMMGVILTLSAVSLTAADSVENPVIAQYCDGTTMAVYPVSFVTRSDGSTFTCGEVSVSPISGGLRYGFEDKDDGDYNDIIIDLRITGQGSGSPVAQVVYVSSDAGYNHEIHLRYSGNDVTVFNAASASPGAVFPVALPTRECPDFRVSATPENQQITAGAAARVTVRVIPEGNYSETVTLTCPGIADGFTAEFLPLAIEPGNDSLLILRTDPTVSPGDYSVTIQGEDGERTRTATVLIRVKQPEVTLNKSFQQATARPGDIVIMELALENGSGTAVTRTRLTDSLPAGLSYLDDNAPVPVNRNGRDLSWDLSRLRAGESHRFSVRLQVDHDAPAGALVNTATVSLAGNASALATANARLEIRVTDVSITKSVDRVQARPGDELVYCLKLENHSPFEIPAISLKDTLSPELAFISSESPLKLSRKDASLEWKGSLAAESTIEVRIRSRILSSVTNGTRISNAATLTISETGTILKSNSISTTVTGVSASPGSIRFRKTCPVPQTEAGRIVRFILELENHSRSLLTDVFIEDPLPQGFTYVPGSASLDGRTLVDPPAATRPGWNLSDIPPGGRISLSFQTVIAADAQRGRHINRARLRARDTMGKAVDLSAEALIYVSSGGMVFLTGIEGTVFLDRNGDGFLEPGEPTLAGIAVRLSTGDEAISDREGRYRMENLYPGEYVLSVNPTTLPERFRRADALPRLVVLSDGLTETVDFPLRFRGDAEKPLARLEGRVFFDRDGNGLFSPGDILAESFRVRLDDTMETNGRNGGFVFTRVPPGKHTIAIIASGIQAAKTVNLDSGRSAIDIPLKYSGLTITVKGEK